MANSTTTKNAENVTLPKGNNKGNILLQTKNARIVTLYSMPIFRYK